MLIERIFFDIYLCKKNKSHTFFFHALSPFSLGRKKFGTHKQNQGRQGPCLLVSPFANLLHAMRCHFCSAMQINFVTGFRCKASPAANESHAKTISPPLPHVSQVFSNGFSPQKATSFPKRKHQVPEYMSHVSKKLGSGVVPLPHVSL